MAVEDAGVGGVSFAVMEQVETDLWGGKWVQVCVFDNYVDAEAEMYWRRDNGATVKMIEPGVTTLGTDGKW